MQNLLSNKSIKSSFSHSHIFFLLFPFHFSLLLHFPHFYYSFLSSFFSAFSIPFLFLISLLIPFPLSYLPLPSLSHLPLPFHPYFYFPSLSCLLSPFPFFTSLSYLFFFTFYIIFPLSSSCFLFRFIFYFSYLKCFYSILFPFFFFTFVWSFQTLVRSNQGRSECFLSPFSQLSSYINKWYRRKSRRREIILNRLGCQ